MLHGALLYPGVPDEKFFESLHAIKHVKWEAVISTANRKPGVVIDDLLPVNCNMVNILDPDFTSFPFLASLVRKGCHLFLTERQMMVSAERMKLIELAEEGNTLIQIRNDLLFYPSLLADKKHNAGAKLIDIHQVAPKSPELLQEMLYNNLLMVLRMVESEPSRISVCSIPNAAYQPEVVNLHLNFHNGSAATLTLSFHGTKKEHLVSLHDATGVTNYNFAENKHLSAHFDPQTDNENIAYNNLIFKQIFYFSECILKKECQRSGLNEEAKALRLMEKIFQKLEYSLVPL